MEEMDTMQTSEYSDIAPDAEKAKVEVKVDAPGGLAALPPASESSEKWRQIGEQISGFFAELPEYLGEFFSEYQRPLTTLGLILASVITVKVTLAVLDAINDIPLLAPTFELVGIGYSAWFVYRYLLRASNRQELSEEFKTLKGQVIGQDTMS
ncbi:CAAD domain-containing protein [Trichocoleus sp. FACHB-40]|nr:CAAD domain-containing protein [Trichocoleus sp. FACHB-40]